MSSSALLYLGSTLASSLTMVLLCLRNDAIRSRYDLASLGASRHAYTLAACAAALFALVLLLRTDSNSMALLLWFLQHGGAGLLVAIGTPYAASLTR